jgi:hypothetical protein
VNILPFFEAWIVYLSQKGMSSHLLVLITFNPPIPLFLHNNLVDCAAAEGQFHDLDREVFWKGPVRGWRRKASVTVGAVVKKTGRTPNFTTGRITAVSAKVKG